MCCIDLVKDFNDLLVGDIVTAVPYKVLPQGAVDKERILGQVTYAALPEGKVLIIESDAVDVNLAFGRFLKSGDDINEGCFTPA